MCVRERGEREGIKEQNREKDGYGERQKERIIKKQGGRGERERE